MSIMPYFPPSTQRKDIYSSQNKTKFYFATHLSIFYLKLRKTSVSVCVCVYTYTLTLSQKSEDILSTFSHFAFFSLKLLHNSIQRYNPISFYSCIIFCLWTDQSLLNYFPIDGNKGYFQSYATINCAKMNRLVHMYFYVHIHLNNLQCYSYIKQSLYVVLQDIIWAYHVSNVDNITFLKV